MSKPKEPVQRLRNLDTSGNWPFWAGCDSMGEVIPDWRGGDGKQACSARIF